MWCIARWASSPRRSPTRDGSRRAQLLARTQAREGGARTQPSCARGRVLDAGDVRGSETAQRRDTAMSGTKAVIGRLAVAIVLVASVLQPPAAAEGSPAQAGTEQRSFG